MAITVEQTIRKFVFYKDDRKVELEDPSPQMDLKAVISHYSNIYPELATATIQGPKMENGFAVYKLIVSLGKNG